MRKDTKVHRSFYLPGEATILKEKCEITAVPTKQHTYHSTNNKTINVQDDRLITFQYGTIGAALSMSAAVAIGIRRH